MTRENNIKASESLKDIFNKSKLLVLADINGVCSEDIREFRQICMKNNIKVKVVKNRIAKFALKENNIDELHDNFTGQTTIIWDDQDCPTIPKLLKEFNQKKNIIRIKCGLYKGNKIDTKYIDILSEIPDIDTLRMKLLYSLTSIHTRLLFSVNYSLYFILNAIKMNKK